MTHNNHIQIIKTHINKNPANVEIDSGTPTRIDMAVNSLFEDDTNSSASQDDFVKQFPTHVAPIGDCYFGPELLEILFNYPEIIVNSPDTAQYLIREIMKRNDSNDLFDERSAKLIQFSSGVASCELIQLMCGLLQRVSSNCG